VLVAVTVDPAAPVMLDDPPAVPVLVVPTDVLVDDEPVVALVEETPVEDVPVVPPSGESPELNSSPPQAKSAKRRKQLRSVAPFPRIEDVSSRVAIVSRCSLQRPGPLFP